MKTKTIALKLNFTSIKHGPFRPTYYKDEWFVEFHGGTNETYEGYMVKIRLSDLEYFFNNFHHKFKAEQARFNKLSQIYDEMEKPN